MLLSKKANIIFIAAVSLLFASCSTKESENSILNDNDQASNVGVTEVISTKENENMTDISSTTKNEESSSFSIRETAS